MCANIWMPSIQNRLLKPPVFQKNPAAKSCSPQNFLSKQSSSHCLVLTLLLPALTTEKPTLHSDLVQLTRIHQNSRDQPLTLLKPHNQALVYYTHSLPPNDQEAISPPTLSSLSGHKTEKGEYRKHCLRLFSRRKRAMDHKCWRSLSLHTNQKGEGAAKAADRARALARKADRRDH